MTTTYLILALISISNARVIDTRIPIAVVDTGVNLNKSNQGYICMGLSTNINSKSSPFLDTNGHGSNIVSIIIHNLDIHKYCIEMIKYEETINTSQTTKALNYAVSTHARYINLSLSGMDSDSQEETAYRTAVSEGIRIAVAAGNNRRNLDVLCNVFPACYPINNKNFHVVGSYTGHFSNIGVAVTHYEDGMFQGTPPLSGTSQATAVHTNRWIRGL